MPMMEGTVQEDDYRTGLKIKIYLKIKAFASSGSQNCGSGI
jgi:hypothetical protein